MPNTPKEPPPSGALQDIADLLRKANAREAARAKEEKASARKLLKSTKAISLNLWKAGIFAPLISAFKSHGALIRTAASEGRKRSDMLMDSFARTGMSFENNIKTMSKVFKAGIRVNERAVAKFAQGMDLLGKDTAAALKLYKTMVDAWGRSSEDALKSTKAIVDTAMRNKISSDALIQALNSLEATLTNAAVYFGPEIKTSMNEAILELTGKYGQESKGVIEGVFNQLLGSKTGWENLMRMGYSLGDATKSKELIRLFEFVRKRATELGPSAHMPTAHERLKVAGLTPELMRAAFVSATNFTKGHGFKTGVDEGKSSLEASLNSLTSTVITMLIPLLDKLAKLLSEWLPKIQRSLESIYAGFTGEEFDKSSHGEGSYNIGKKLRAVTDFSVEHPKTAAAAGLSILMGWNWLKNKIKNFGAPKQSPSSSKTSSPRRIVPEGFFNKLLKSIVDAITRGFNNVRKLFASPRPPATPQGGQQKALPPPQEGQKKTPSAPRRPVTQSQIASQFRNRAIFGSIGSLVSAAFLISEAGMYLKEKQEEEWEQLRKEAVKPREKIEREIEALKLGLLAASPDDTELITELKGLISVQKELLAELLKQPPYAGQIVPLSSDGWTGHPRYKIND